MSKLGARDAGKTSFNLSASWLNPKWFPHVKKPQAGGYRRMVIIDRPIPSQPARATLMFADTRKAISVSARDLAN